MQRCTIYFFLWDALHVSGGSSAHHQELKTVYTTSGTLSHLYCYLPLSWKILKWQWQVAVRVWRSKRCCIYSFWAPHDGRRNRLKHVEHFTDINKLCNVTSRWLYLEIHLFKVPDRCHGPAVTPAPVIPGTRANPNAAEKNSTRASAGNRTHVPWSYPTGQSDGATGLQCS